MKKSEVPVEGSRLVFEGAPADKFAKNGGRGNLFSVHCGEQIEKLEQPAGFAEFMGRVGDLAQQRSDIIFQNGQLVEKRGVEDHVGLFLIGEDVLVLASADAFPASKRVGGVVAPSAVIANDASDQPIVGRRNAVQVVDRDGGQG